MLKLNDKDVNRLTTVAGCYLDEHGSDAIGVKELVHAITVSSRFLFERHARYGHDDARKKIAAIERAALLSMLRLHIDREFQDDHA